MKEKADPYVTFWMKAAEEFTALAEFFTKEALDARKRAAARAASFAFRKGEEAV